MWGSSLLSKSSSKVVELIQNYSEKSYHCGIFKVLKNMSCCFPKTKVVPVKTPGETATKAQPHRIRPYVSNPEPLFGHIPIRIREHTIDDLINAVNFRELKLIKTLLTSKEININDGDHRGDTPLHHAARVQIPQITKMLLKNGAQVDKQNNDGSTSLHLAAEKGDAATVRILLAYDAKLLIKNNSGATALEIACLQVTPYYVSKPHQNVVELIEACNKTDQVCCVIS